MLLLKMRNLKTCIHAISFLLFCSTPIFGKIDQSKWVDPYDMSPVYDKEYFPYDIDTPNIEKNCDIQKIEGPSKAYLKRVINMILNAVYKDSFNDHLYRGHIIFEMDVQKFSKLYEFANNAETSDHYLHEIDSILSEILKKPSHDYLKEYFSNWFVKIFKILSSRSGILGICILSYVFVVYKMLKGNFNYWAIFKFLFINLIFFDFAFVWIRLYQKAEINKMVDSNKFKNAPDYCNPQNLNSMQYIWSLLSTVDKCKEYHHVTLTDIFWSVSPGDVLTEMVTKAITEPMKAIGPAVGQFVYGIYGALPFGVNIILLPLVLIFVMVMSCITLSFVLSIPIKFNFFHLISFSFGDHGGQRNTNNGNVLTGQTVDKLLDIVKENNTNPNRFIEEPEPIVSSSNNAIITRELIRQLSQISLKSTENINETKNDSEINLPKAIAEKQKIGFDDNRTHRDKSEDKNILEINSQKAILEKRSGFDDDKAQSGTSEVDNILEESDFVERLKEILESPTIDSESHKNSPKTGFEPNVIGEVTFDERNENLKEKKRKRNDGAGDF